MQLGKCKQKIALAAVPVVKILQPTKQHVNKRVVL